MSPTTQEQTLLELVDKLDPRDRQDWREIVHERVQEAIEHHCPTWELESLENVLWELVS